VSLVIIDLDGTLLEGEVSSEKLFFRFLLERRIIGLRQLSAYFFFMPRWFSTYGLMTAKKNKAYLAGLKVSTIEKAAAEFVKERLIDHCCRELKHRIRNHLEQGDVTVLVTGSLEMIARPVCSAFGIQHMRATRCSMQNSIFTSNPPLVHPFGPDKLTISREIGQQLGYDLAGATAYGNDIYDRDLLEAVSRPVAVHPDKGLRKHALARSWEIIEH
jgi:HAD superfamily phosphoserine phosphatase-like hydrolase